MLIDSRACVFCWSETAKGEHKHVTSCVADGAAPAVVGGARCHDCGRCAAGQRREPEGVWNYFLFFSPEIVLSFWVFLDLVSLFHDKRKLPFIH